MEAEAVKKLTGRKVLFIFIAFFGVILAVNMALLFSALGTWPGLEVANSYVASQEFNAKASAQRALGWTPSVSYADGVLRVDLWDETGVMAMPESLHAKVGRPTEAREDQEVDFTLSSTGHTAELVLTPGPWRVFLDGRAYDGTAYSVRLNLLVPEE